MKICKNCGARFQEDEAFCGSCGSPLNAEDIQQETPPAELSAVQSAPADATAAPVPVATPRKKWGWIIGGACALAAVLCVGVFGWINGWFSPDTAKKDKSKDSAQNGVLQSMSINVKLKEDDEYFRMNLRMCLDPKNKSVIIMGETNGVDMLMKDSTVYYMTDGYADKQHFDMPTQFFDFTLNGQSVNNLDWETLIEQMGAEDMVNADELPGLIDRFKEEYLNDPEWQKQALGYTEKDGVYTIRPDMVEVLETVIELLEDSDVIVQLYKSDALNALDALVDSVEDGEMDFDLLCEITTQNNVLTDMDVEFELENAETEIGLYMEISDINKTEISEEEVEEFIEQVEQQPGTETCDDCGETVEDDHHGDCDICLEHGKLYQVGDYLLCADCYKSQSGYGFA